MVLEHLSLEGSSNQPGSCQRYLCPWCEQLQHCYHLLAKQEYQVGRSSRQYTPQSLLLLRDPCTLCQLGMGDIDAQSKGWCRGYMYQVDSQCRC